MTVECVEVNAFKCFNYTVVFYLFNYTVNCSNYTIVPSTREITFLM